MSRSRTRLIVGILFLSFAGCGEGAPLDVTAADEASATEPVTDLMVLAPIPTSSDLTSVSVRRAAVPEGVIPWIYYPDDNRPRSAQIYSARTRVGLYPGEAFSRASHRYTGTSGRISTELSVTWGDQDLGSQVSTEQASDVLSFDLVKYITTFASINTDQTCGLSAQARTEHSAWWELFQGKSAPAFGMAITTTRDGPMSQGRCGRIIKGGDPTGGTRNTTGISCAYLITYDLDTLQILKVELLGCSSTGSERL